MFLKNRLIKKSSYCVLTLSVLQVRQPICVLCNPNHLSNPGTEEITLYQNLRTHGSANQHFAELNFVSQSHRCLLFRTLIEQIDFSGTNWFF